MEDWWRTKHGEFGSSRESRNYARLGKGRSKEFYEELQPLMAFMRVRYPDASGVKCKPRVGNQPFDGELLFPSGEVARVEVTFAKDGWAENAQMTELIESGRVDGTYLPTIRKEKGKKKEVKFRENEMRCLEDLSREVQFEIKAKLAQKNSKSYLDGTILIIAFYDDRLDYAGVQDEFRSLFRSLAHNFAALYLVGVHGRIFVGPDEVGGYRS